MGQKIHPLGFRVGISKKHKSTWYAKFKQYTKFLREDDYIRNYLINFKNRTRISDIEIIRNRIKNQIYLIITTKDPGYIVGHFGTELYNLKNYLANKLSLKYQIQITINEIKHENIFYQAKSLANLIVEKLEKRIAYKTAIGNILDSINKKRIKGLKIQISGCLNGDARSKSYWIKQGQIPLHSIKTNIDYATSEAHTKYGILGIKIWIFNDKIF